MGFLPFFSDIHGHTPTMLKMVLSSPFAAGTFLEPTTPRNP
jgi:hypothetical protein